MPQELTLTIGPTTALMYACRAGHAEIVQLLTTASFVHMFYGKTGFERPIGAIPVDIPVDEGKDGEEEEGGVGGGGGGDGGEGVISNMEKESGIKQPEGFVRTTPMKEAIKNSSRIALLLFNLCCTKPVVRKSKTDQRQTVTRGRQISNNTESINYCLECRNDFVIAERMEDTR